MALPQGIQKISTADRDDYYLGTLFAGTAPYHVGAYSDGAFSVPAHWWNAVARNRKVPLAIKKTPAQIVAANRMFPYGDTGAKVGPFSAYTYKGPMDSAGITLYMPMTGERPDIGLITDPSAYYMLTGNPGPMLAWGQGASSCPNKFRDENTGKPVSLLTYPSANCYQGNQGSPRFDIGPPIPATGTVYLPDGTLDKNDPGYNRGSNGYQVFGGDWTPQQAHYCEMSYLAHVATLDTGFLEDLQYSANFTVLCDAWLSAQRKIATVWGELRGIAWAFRNLFMAHAATLDAEARGDLPASCHPSSYWKTLLDNQLAYYTATYKDDPKNDYYRLVSGGNRFGPWQVDYILSALAFGVLTGHSDWVPLYLWALKNVIDRTSGKSGYPVGWGGAYYLNTCPWKKTPDGTYNQWEFDTAAPFDWAGTFLFQQNDPNGAQPTASQIATLKTDQFNGGKAMQGNEYLMTTRAVLVQAQYLHKIGLVDVKAVYPDLDLCFTNADRMVRNYGSINPRQSVVLDTSKVPDTLPPPPPPIEPPPVTPPTEIHMSSTKLRVGESKVAALTISPADADKTGLSYTASPDGLVTLEAADNGVKVTRVAAGTAVIKAHLNGLEASAEALDAAPLAQSLSLEWAS